MRPGQQFEAAQRQHADLCKLITRFWSRVLPVTLQIPMSSLYSGALWRGLTALFSQRVSFPFIDVGRPNHDSRMRKFTACSRAIQEAFTEGHCSILPTLTAAHKTQWSWAY
eukprot:1128002-Pelagomonas_calceolata.AAC.11